MADYRGSRLHPESVWVGVDLGTQSVRAIAIGDDGAMVAVAARPLTSRRDEIRHEQDPAQWWSATCGALQEVTAGLDAGRVVRAVAVSSTSGTVVVVDDRHRPVSVGIMYDDARGAAHTERINEVGGAVWNRLGYRMQGSWALPTILELSAAGELTGGRSVVHQPDIITAHLTGHPTPSDSSHALKTGFDLDQLVWPESVLAELGLRLENLPDVVEPGTVIGAVDKVASDETGLPTGCSVVAGMTDGCAAQIAAGALSDGRWNSVLGTTLVVKGASRTRRTDPTGAVYAHRAPFGAGWFPGGASSTGAGALSHWLPGADLPSLSDQASVRDAAICYPLVGRGERFPFVAPDAKAFFGESEEPPAGAADRFASIAHGTAFVERLCYDLLDLTGYDTSGRLSLTGGGSRSAWWNQLRANVLARPVDVPPQGQGATGMAILAAAALDGAASDGRLARAAERLLPASATIEPRPMSPGPYLAFINRLHELGWLGDELHQHASRRAG